MCCEMTKGVNIYQTNTCVCVFAFPYVQITSHLRLVLSILPVSLDCTFLFALSVFL